MKKNGFTTANKGYGALIVLFTLTFLWDNWPGAKTVPTLWTIVGLYLSSSLLWFWLSWQRQHGYDRLLAWGMIGQVVALALADMTTALAPAQQLTLALLHKAVIFLSLICLFLAAWQAFHSKQQAQDD
ncbi:hypothetical protein PT274_04140 [Leuconostocaceae bacterium ESL0958]|nr:hypothetical protein [Leuconostocaceae bacterium ESL0958]